MTPRTLSMRIDDLPIPLRVAVGAVCLERVLPILDAVADETSEPCRAAIALVWRYAEGETLERAEIEAALDGLSQEEPEEDATGGTLERIQSLLTTAVRNLLLRVRSSPFVNLEQQAVDHVREAVFLFEKHEDVGNDWAVLEDEWQSQVVALAETSRDPRALRAFHSTPVWQKQIDEEW